MPNDFYIDVPPVTSQHRLHPQIKDSSRNTTRNTSSAATRNVSSRSEIPSTMREEEPTQYDDTQPAGGLGAPTPLGQLEGNGIHARDIKAIIEAGYNTVESVAYTYEMS